MLSYKGNVKTVTELTYRYPEQDSKVSNDTSIYYSQYIFDENGNITSIFDYTSDSYVKLSDTINTINTIENNKIIKSITYLKNEVISNSVYNWTNDTEITVLDFRNDTLEYKRQITLNNKFQETTKRLTHYGTDTLTSVFAYAYNQEGNKVENNLSIPQLSHTSNTVIRIIEKDKYGNPLHTKSYDSKTGKLSSENIISYTYYK